jgi:hypothetical protein
MLDDPDQLALLSRWITSAGHQVHGYLRGNEVLKNAAREGTRRIYSADANALGKCVSALTQLSTNTQTKTDISAAKTCKTELAASKTNFATTYGAGRNAFGVCVARHSKL